MRFRRKKIGIKLEKVEIGEEKPKIEVKGKENGG